MATINFQLSSKVRKNKNDYQILLRFSFNRQTVLRAKTNLYVQGKNWDAKKQKVVIPRVRVKGMEELVKLQKTLEELRGFILEQCISMHESKIDKTWLDHIINVFHYGDSYQESVDQADIAPQDLFQVMDLYISTQIKPGNRTAHFRSLYQMLKRFELYRSKTEKLHLEKFTDIDLNSFEKFLRQEHTFFNQDKECIKNAFIYRAYPIKRIPEERGTNALNNIMKRFRTFYKWALKTKRTSKNPFDNYKVPSCVYGTPFFLTIEERNQLFNLDLSSRPQLAIQRDIFVFQSCIGIRPGDYYGLTAANVVDDAIEYIPSKTIDGKGTVVRVPLCEQAKFILSSYMEYDGETLFPFISMQKYNKRIKEMLKLAGITRIVTILNPTSRKEEQHPICDVATAYMARRNFIGALYKQVQDPNLIGSMTGHTEGSKAFARYRAIDDDIKKAVIKCLD